MIQRCIQTHTVCSILVALAQSNGFRTLVPSQRNKKLNTRQAAGVLYPDLSGAIRTLGSTEGIKHGQNYGRAAEKRERAWTKGVDPSNKVREGGSKVDIIIRRWEGVREWENRWMLASPGPWRLRVAVALLEYWSSSCLFIKLTLSL